jgi:transposase
MTNKEAIKRVIAFLTMFMPQTLAKRVVCIILHAVGVSSLQISELTGFCVKTVVRVNTKIDAGQIDDLFKISGGGRKSKTSGIEESIVEEINRNQYHSRQEIADMIYANHGIKLSVSAVGDFLKKRVLNG